MRKGVSGIIIALIILIVSVSLAGALYFWASTTTTSLKETAESRAERETASGAGIVIPKIESYAASSEVIVRNEGRIAISTDELEVFVNGALADSDASTESIMPGESVTLTIYSSLSECDVIRVTGQEGTIDELVYEITPGSCVGTNDEGSSIPGPDSNPSPPDSGQQSAIPTDGLVSYWKFDEGSATSAKDSHGNNHGTLVNSPQWKSGINGTGLGFYLPDGSRVEVPHHSSLTPPQMSVSLWLKSNDWVQGLISKITYSPASQAKGYDLRINERRVELYSRDGNSIDNLYTSTNVIHYNKWQHIVFTIGADGRKIYVDGVLLASDTLQTSVAASTANLWIGRDVVEGWGPQHNTIDEVRIYSRVLTAEEVLNIYNEEKP